MLLYIAQYTGKEQMERHYKNMNIYKIYIIIMIFTLNACSAFDITKPGSPTMHWMYEGPRPEKGKNYHPDYVEGWQDGCHTGVSANTNAWYKEFYQFRQNAYKTSNQNYYKGWKDAFSFCGRYIYQYNRKVGL